MQREEWRTTTQELIQNQLGMLYCPPRVGIRTPSPVGFPGILGNPPGLVLGDDLALEERKTNSA